MIIQHLDLHFFFFIFHFLLLVFFFFFFSLLTLLLESNWPAPPWCPSGPLTTSFSLTSFGGPILFIIGFHHLHTIPKRKQWALNLIKVKKKGKSVLKKLYTNNVVPNLAALFTIRNLAYKLSFG